MYVIAMSGKNNGQLAYISPPSPWKNGHVPDARTPEHARKFRDVGDCADFLAARGVVLEWPGDARRPRGLLAGVRYEVVPWEGCHACA